jgi:hypothetical protein
MSDLRRSVLSLIPSPYGCAAFSCGVFLVAWLFPPQIYTRYLLETDLIYHNGTALGFVALCVTVYLAGVRVVDVVSVRSRPSSTRRRVRSNVGLLYLAAPLCVAGSLCGVYLLLITRDTNFVALLLAQRGDVIKQAITGGSSSGYWGSTLFLLTGVLWWAAYRSREIKLEGKPKKIFSAIYLAYFAIDLLTCLATFDRTNLMPLLAGSLIIVLFFRTRERRASVFAIGLAIAASGIAIAGAFVTLQFARSAAQLDDITRKVLGYTIASYNRLAALLLGAMHYEYPGRGAYLVAFVTQNGRLHLLREQMGLPDFYQVWLSEFASVQASGLNPAYNWASIFGYLYSDLRWWAPLYFLAAGLVSGFLWSRFRAGATVGIVLYPMIAFWILFWFGWNLLLDARTIALLETTIMLIAYDGLSLVRDRPTISHAHVTHSSWGTLLPTGDRPKDLNRWSSIE